MRTWDEPAARWFWRLALAVDAVALSWLVWTPARAHRCDAATSWLGHAFCLSPALQWAGNVMLLVPTALLIAVNWPHLRRTRIALAMLLLTCTIETVQHWIPGRVPDWRDVATNALGAWVALALSAPRYQHL